MSRLAARDRLIAALDAPTAREALRLVRRLRPAVRWFKIGSVLFTAEGPSIVRAVQARDGRIFLDLKFHDIPTTVAKSCASAARLRVGMLTLHAQGGLAMLQAARAAVHEVAPSRRPLLVAVTQLTSDQGFDLRTVLARAKLAKAARLDGVVAPPAAVAAVRRACGQQFVIVTPGIRPVGTGTDDHAAPATAAAALRAGATYLVVGRPIAEAHDPRRAAADLLQEMETAYGS